jgi:ubiquinone biosynthesis protein
MDRGEVMMRSLVQHHPPAAALARLKAEAALTAQDLPALIGAWLHRAQRMGGVPTVGIDVPELRSLEAHLDRASNRLALALVTLGLYIAASLLMQHSIGPRIFGDIPVLGVLGYVLALWLSVRLVRTANRAGRL